MNGASMLVILRFLSKILYRLVESFLKKDKTIEFIGPIGIDDLNLLELKSFKDHILTDSAPYLYSHEAIKNEERLKLDERSYHFGIKKDGELMAYVRLSPSTFELSQLSPIFDTISRHYDDYIEFNRLVANPKILKRGYYAKLLLLFVGLWLFSKSKYRGIIATCREERTEFLTSFGIRPMIGIETFLSDRNGRYQLLVGSKKQILTEIFKNYLNQTRLFKIQKTESTTIKQN